MLTSETSDTGIKSKIVPILKEPGRFAQNILSRENSSGWDIPSTKWKASLCHRRHTRHHRWHFKIGARFCPRYIQTLSVLRWSVWLRCYWKIIYRAFWDSSWMAVEKHGQYFSRGWQSMKVFLIPRIPQDLVLPLFSGIWPLTLYFHHPEKQICLWSSSIFKISWTRKTSQHHQSALISSS